MALSTEQVRLILDAKDETGPAFSTAESSMLGLGKNATFLVGALGAIATAFSATELIEEIVSVTRQFETLQATLTTATGSEFGSAVVFDKLREFARETPYQIDEVVNAFSRLKNLGLDPSMEALTSYGNTAGAMGKSLNDMIEAVADATVGEFERLKEFGIKAKSEGQNVTFTFRGMATTIQKSAAEIESYLRGLGDVEFAGGMQRQMETLDGVISNFGVAWDELIYSIGEESGLGEAIKGGVNISVEALDRLRRAIAATNEEKLEDLRNELDHTLGQIDAANNTPGLTWAWDVEGLRKYKDELVSQIDEIEGKMAAADVQFQLATTGLINISDSTKLATAEAKLLADAEDEQASAVEKAKQKLLDKEKALLTQKQAEFELAGMTREEAKASAEAAIAADQHAEKLDKQSKSAKESAEQANKLAVEMEKIASNERIKTIEFSVELETERIKAELAEVEALFSSIDTAIQSTGSLLSSLTGDFLNASNFGDKWFLEDLIKDENKRREDTFELQQKLGKEELRMLELKRKRLADGNALLQVEMSGVYPELDMVMYKLLERAQIRISEEASEMLLGI